MSFLPVFIGLFSRNVQGQQVFQPNAVQEAARVVQAGTTAAAPEARYFRLICLVPMTGTGKHNDPIRPEFIPTGAASSRDGILSWSVQMTDDRKMAIVHLVAANRKAFDAIMNDKRGEIRVFEIGKHGKDTIETYASGEPLFPTAK